jgi:hypothetical protein
MCLLSTRVGGAVLHLPHFPLHSTTTSARSYTDNTCMSFCSGVVAIWNGLNAAVLPLCAATCSPIPRIRSAPRPGGGGRFSLSPLRCCLRYSCSLRRCRFFSSPTWISIALRTGISLVLVSSSSYSRGLWWAAIGVRGSDTDVISAGRSPIPPNRIDISVRCRDARMLADPRRVGGGDRSRTGAGDRARLGDVPNSPLGGGDR